jgi:hypothetical protein
LAALTKGNVKSPFTSAAKVAEDCGLKETSVQRAFDIAALPIARGVIVQPDGQSNTKQFRLANDLFAPAVQSLARRAEVERARRNRFLLTDSLVLGALIVAAIFGFLYRNANEQKRIATR